MNNATLYAFRFCAIAAAYWGSSWLGKHMAIPFGQATDIWLAAGVALACCILYGNKYWPAIVVGSLLTHYQMHSTIHMSGITIGIGGGLQAAFGAWAFKKTARKNISGETDIYTLEKAGDIIKLIFWGGIVACMINATIGTVSLARTDWTQLGIEIAHWYVWWTGDILGIILFTPALILILSDIRNTPRKVSVRRKLSIASSGLIMFLAVTIIFAVIKREYYNQSNELFRDNAQNIAGRLENNFELYLNTISAVKNFVSSSETVSFDAFRFFTTPFLEQYSSITALAWAPKITKDRRAAFEKNIQEQGFADFNIKQRTETGTFTTSEERPLHFPVSYIQPYKQASMIAGLDVYADPAFKELLDAAADSNSPRSYLSFHQTQNTPLYDIIIFTPVYSHEPAIPSAETNRQSLAGYAIGVFLLSDLLQEAYQIARENGQNFIIKDVGIQNGKNGNAVFYDTRTENRKADNDLSYNFEMRTHVTERIKMADRVWEFIFIKAGKATQFTHYSWGLWFTITLGTLFSIITTVFLLVITARTDIVERLVAQKTSALKSAEAFQNLVTDTIPDFVTVKDSDLRFVSVNKAVKDRMPKPLQNKFLERTSADFLTEDQAKLDREMDLKTLKEGHTENEERITPVSGSSMIISNKRVAFKDNEGNDYILSVARDITDMKEHEKELQNLNLELEEFSYRTSHDLRAPVVSALGLLDLVRSSLDQGKTDEAYRGIEHIYNALQKVDVLVEGILDITAIKRKEEEKKAVNIKKLVNDAIEKFRFMDNSENLDIQKDLHFKGTLISQESRIKVILENLLSNAVKYHDPEKDHPFIKISTEQEGNDFVLRIEDNGLGIPKIYQGKLFRMFKRFHPKVSFGSGLGLYLVKKSADVLKGKVTYEDTGNGSAFTFRLPLQNNGE